MGYGTLVLARDRLERVAQLGGGVSAACSAIVAAFRDVTPFFACSLMTIDPVTLLPAGGVAEGMTPADWATFWDNELLEADVNKFTVLASKGDPVVTLHESLAGDLGQSPRYTKLYATYQAADEMRVAFRNGAACLAVGAFIRAGADGPFPATDLAAIRSLLPVSARLLRRALARDSRNQRDQVPVVVVLCPNGSIAGMTGGAAAVLDDLREADEATASDRSLPQIVRTVVVRARTETGSAPFATRALGRSGHWYRIHVSPLDDGTLAVTILAAQPDDLTAMLLDSYGLTSRESDVMVMLARGLPMKDIAADLFLSPHTVRDHVKAIYEKAGVNSRSALIAQLFTAHFPATWNGPMRV